MEACMSSVAITRNSKYSQRVNRRQGREPLELQKLFKGLIILLSLILIVQLIFHFLLAPHLVIRQVRIETSDDFPYSNREIVELSGFEGGSYYFDVDPKLLAAKLEQVPMIKEAVVNKSFPHGLSISISEREAVSILTFQGEEGVGTAYVDAEGVLFQGGQGQNLDLPVISGVEVPAYREGMQLPEVLRGFLSDLEELHGDNPSLYSLISELKFVKKSATEYEVVMYPSYYPVKVRLGSTLSEDLMKYIVLVLDVVAGRGMANDIEELDFRTDQVVYRLGRE